jgi:hypothetical protein
LLLNNTNLHEEEKFKFMFLLYSKDKKYISMLDLEIILKVNLGGRFKENLKKINEIYEKVSMEISIDIEYEFQNLMRVYKANNELFK